MSAPVDYQLDVTTLATDYVVDRRHNIPVFRNDCNIRFCVASPVEYWKAIESQTPLAVECLPLPIAYKNRVYLSGVQTQPLHWGPRRG